ncbi:MAG: hypothetical protein RL732_13 [Bacteroidota bacterium]
MAQLLTMNRPLTKRLHFPFFALLAILSITLLSAFKGSPIKKHSNASLDLIRFTATKISIASSLFDENKSLFDDLHLGDFGLSRKVFEMALKGMEKLDNKNRLNLNILTIADFSKPSNEKRLFVIDLENDLLLFHTWVAHGRNTGGMMARYFSNTPRSRKSSLGFYRTGHSYQGSNGYSLKLQGLEPGVNSNAEKRGIVIHGADYVGEDIIASKGYLGRSQGCPAITPELTQPLINTIKDGSCFFIYYPSQPYISRSSYLN